MENITNLKKKYLQNNDMYFCGIIKLLNLALINIKFICLK